MRVFVLGGYGKTGLAAIKLLAQSDLVTGIAVAGRNLGRAEKAAREIGEKAIAIQADGTDEQKLISQSAGYDFIVNAANNQVVLPSIQAAIHNRAHYCDMAWGDILEQAQQLGPLAQAAGISVIVSTGISPCISNLIGVHASRQLEEVEQLQIGRADIFSFQSGRELSPRQWQEDPKDSNAELQEYKPFIGWMLQRVQENGIRSVLVYRDGEWVEIDPLQDGLSVPLTQGGRTTSRPYMSGDDAWGMLPTDLSKATPVEMSFSPFPPQLGAVLQEQALGVLAGKIDAETATNNFFETIARDPYHWLVPSDDFIPPAKLWVTAVGHKEGRAARYSCWFTAPMWNVNGYFLTSVALVAAVRMVLRGENQARGVMTAEKAFEPLSFIDEVTALIPDFLRDGKLTDESFEWLA